MFLQTLLSILQEKAFKRGIPAKPGRITCLIQSAFDILSTLVLRDHSKWKPNKNEHGEGDNAYPNFYSKSNK